MRSTLEVDIYADLGVDGPHASVFFGDECEPLVETTTSWEDIISREIEYHTVPSMDYIPYENVDELHRCFDIVRTLRVVADEIESRLLKLDALDRKAWLEANNGKYDGDRAPFIKPLKEVINYES